MKENYDDFVTFLIASFLSEELYDKNNFTHEEVWEHCVHLAKRFEKEQCGNESEALIDSVEDYLEEMKEEE